MTTVGFIGSGHIGGTTGEACGDGRTLGDLEYSRGRDAHWPRARPRPGGSGGDRCRSGRRRGHRRGQHPAEGPPNRARWAAGRRIVIDTNNYYPGRDGQIADLDSGSTTSRRAAATAPAGGRGSRSSITSSISTCTHWPAPRRARPQLSAHRRRRPGRERGRECVPGSIGLSPSTPAAVRRMAPAARRARLRHPIRLLRRRKGAPPTPDRARSRWHAPGRTDRGCAACRRGGQVVTAAGQAQWRYAPENPSGSRRYHVREVPVGRRSETDGFINPGCYGRVEDERQHHFGVRCPPASGRCGPRTRRSPAFRPRTTRRRGTAPGHDAAPHPARARPRTSEAGYGQDIGGPGIASPAAGTAA